MVNRTIVEGQIAGGAGAGHRSLERIVYDEAGRLRSAPPSTISSDRGRRAAIEIEHPGVIARGPVDPGRRGERCDRRCPAFSSWIEDSLAPFDAGHPLHRLPQAISRSSAGDRGSELDVSSSDLIGLRGRHSTHSLIAGRPKIVSQYAAALGVPAPRRRSEAGAHRRTSRRRRWARPEQVGAAAGGGHSRQMVRMRSTSACAGPHRGPRATP